jgi:glycerophosphoryl diester phosphodiesterase
MGAHAVELDVRRTLDGVLIVHHNPTLADSRVIAACHSSELPAHVPRLGAALDACTGMWVNVEIKNEPDEPDFDEMELIADETMELLIARGEPERWLISSFRMETIDRCHSISNDRGVPIRTAWLTSDVSDSGNQHVAQRVAARGHVALHPWVKVVTRDLIERCHREGLQVNTWTCDDPARMRELIEWGIDGICTNVPDVGLRAVADPAERS